MDPECVNLSTGPIALLNLDKGLLIPTHGHGQEQEVGAGLRSRAIDPLESHDLSTGGAS